MSLTLLAATTFGMIAVGVGGVVGRRRGALLGALAGVGLFVAGAIVFIGVLGRSLPM